MTSCQLKLSDFPFLTGCSNTQFVIPVLNYETGDYENYNIDYLDLICSMNQSGTYSNGFIYFSGNGVNFSVDVSGLLDDTNTYTTGGTMSGDTLVLTRNDGVNIYVDLSKYNYDITLNSIVNNFNSHTGDTNNPHLTSFYNLTETGHTHNVGDVNFSAGCVSDLWVTNVHGCSPITFHNQMRNPGCVSDGYLSNSFGYNTLSIGDFSNSSGSGTTSGARRFEILPDSINYGLITIPTEIDFSDYFTSSDYSFLDKTRQYVNYFNFNPPTSSATIFEKIIQFSGDSMGSNPTTSLIIDDILYGLTVHSGLYGNGTIFKYDTINHQFTTLIDFDSNFTDLLGTKIINSGNTIYGISIAIGSITNYDKLFKYDITTNQITILHTFSTPLNGNYVNDLLIYNNDIYGITLYGGSYDFGVMFKYDLINNTYTKLIDFSGALNGQNPKSILLNQNKIYGVTSYGGNDNVGTIFEFSSNTLTKLYDFSFSGDSFIPIQIKLSNDGFIYGSTNNGLGNCSTLFKYDTQLNTVTKLMDFNSYMVYAGPSTNFLITSDNKIYGIGDFGSDISDVAISYGFLFKYDIQTNNFTNLFNFRNSMGEQPNSISINSLENKVFGTTWYDNTNNGILFKYSIGCGVIGSTFTIQLDDNTIFDGQHIFDINHPNSPYATNIIGINTYSIGENNMALNDYSLVGGLDSKSIGKHSFVFSKNSYNASDGGVILGGINNSIRDWYTYDVSVPVTIIGSSNSSIKDSNYSSSIISSTNSQIYGYGWNNVIIGDNSTINNSRYSLILNGQSDIINKTNNVYIIGSNNSHIDLVDNSQIVGGINNRILNDCNLDILLNGQNNLISGTSIISTIISGTDNKILDNVTYSTILNGFENIISGNTQIGTIIGSNASRINNYGQYSAIIGGYDNEISDIATYSSILAGRTNIITNGINFSTIIGGGYNGIYGPSSYNTIVNSYYCLMSGGSGSFINGGNNEMYSCDDSALISGQENTMFMSLESIILGGSRNLIGGYDIDNGGYNSRNVGILNGVYNIIYSGNNSVIIGGNNNKISSVDNTIILGGNHITATSSNTVYTPYLNIQSITTDNNQINVLVRNPNGDIQLRDASTILTTTLPYSAITNTAHTHTIGDIVNLQTSLNNKTETSVFNYHTGDTTVHFTKSSISLNQLGSSAHTHTIGDIVNYLNTYTTGGTVNGNTLILRRNDGVGINIDLSPFKFTGNTSGDCITNLYVHNLGGCSPINILTDINSNSSISATTYYGDGSKLLGVSSSNIPNPIITIEYNITNKVTKQIEDLGSGKTLERRYRYYSGGTNQDGSIDIMEVSDTKSNEWKRVTYSYTNGLLTSTSISTIIAWTI